MSFISNLKTMLGGFALAQLIPLLAVPVFTRLYTPEAFGFQSLFMGSVAVLAVVSTLRLDLALLLADDEEEEGRLVGLIAATVVGVLVVVAIVIAFFGDLIADRLGGTDSRAWMWLLLPMVMATAFVQVATSLLARQKRFGPIARTNVLNQVGYVAFASSGGALLGSQGLVVAKLSGQLVGALLMIRNVAHPLRLYARLPNREQTSHLWQRFHQFVIFNTPYSLIGTVARDMPIYVFSAMAAASAAGFYGLARTVLSVPMLFTAAALSQVFYREAVEFRGTRRIEAITGALLGLTMRGTAPLFAFICIWGDVVFGTLFGVGWVEAGVYAMILAPAAWLGVQTGWPERTLRSRRAPGGFIQSSDEL